MKRRIIVLALCTVLVALCGSVDAQQTGKVFRVGYLEPGIVSGNAVLLDGFRYEPAAGYVIILEGLDALRTIMLSELAIGETPCAYISSAVHKF